MRISPINSNYLQYANLQKETKRTVDFSDNIAFKSNISTKSSMQVINKIKKIVIDNLKIICILILAGLAQYRYIDTKRQLGFVEPLQEEFNTKEEAIKYSINRIKEPLNSSNPREYSVLLDAKDFSVESERLGWRDSVTNYVPKYKLKKLFGSENKYISLHGHPDSIYYDNKSATQSFSFQDFETLVDSPNIVETFVVNKFGQYCVLRKKENFKDLTKEEKEELKEKYLYAHSTSWANLIEIHKEGKVSHAFRDYQGIHVFWKYVADKYNLEYYTNFGVYDGVDVYENHYYPELNPPQGKTSHKDFEL